VRNAQTNLIQGLGLGLSFVAWIVKAHGGNIGVTSRVGTGTNFTIHLPAEAGAPVNSEPNDLAPSNVFSKEV
jgi:signal transduction histidine kinase